VGVRIMGGWRRAGTVCCIMASLGAAGGEPVAPLAPLAPLALGHAVRAELALDYVNLNHGSFGVCPRSVLAAQSALRLEQERRPDVWFRATYRALLNETAALVAEQVRAPGGAACVALVENASAAVNGLLRSLPLRAGDVLVYFSVAYNMVKNTVQWLSATQGVEVVEVVVEWPIAAGDEELAFSRPLQRALEALPAARLARVQAVMLDHIVSVPAVVQPVAALAVLVKRLAPQALVLVDGAHAWGQLPGLDLSQLGPIDAYLANAHKWLFAPKGSAFMWLRADKVSPLFPEPTVVSSENARGTLFRSRFDYVGTRDYTAVLALRAALDFRTRLGGDRAIYDYAHGLALSAGDLLARAWNTRLLAPPHMHAMMFNVVLPTQDLARADRMQQWLLEHRNVYMIVLTEPRSGTVYTRLSATVYLELSDFEQLAQLVLNYLAGPDVELAAK
jgi:selenocysteine lyase/cysteine desulfurase